MTKAENQTAGTSLTINNNGANASMGGFVTRFLIRTASLFLIINTLWIAWIQLGPQKPIPDAKRKTVAVESIKKIANTLREHRGDYHSLAILPFANEPTGFIDEELRNEIQSTGIFDLRDRTFFDKIRLFLNMRAYSSDNYETAIHLGQRQKTDLVLYGSVKRFETVEQKARLILDYSLIDTKTGTEVWTELFDSQATDAPVNIIDSISAGAEEVATKHFGSNLNRLFGWILIVLLLPLFTIRFLIVMTAKKSNSVNFFTLAFYTAIDVILAWILVKPESQSPGAWVYFGIFCLSAFLYNVKVMTMAHFQSE